MKGLIKLEYFRPAYEKYVKIIFIVSVIALFFGFDVVLGWVLGNALFFISLCLKNEYYDFILTMKSFNKMLFFFYYIVSMSIIFIVVGIGFLIPQLINAIACCLGFVGFKFYLFFNNILGGEAI